MEDPIGAVLQNRYKVISKVAAGGMGVIYRGERIELERPVAIKFVHAWAANEPTIRKRFEIEVRAMGRIHHPCCVSITDFGVHEGAPYVVMDFVEGETLADVIDEKPMPVERAVEIVEKILAGLAHAHEKGIVHRDIKPKNIMVTERAGFADDVRILDFGLAKLLQQTTAGLTAGIAVGTPSYMSPEQTMGDPIDARTDVYSVGLVLYAMLSGEPPFWSDQAHELMRMQREDAPPPLQNIAPELWAIVARALAKSPDDRFASAVELASALRENQQLRLVRAATPAIVAQPVGTGVSRRTLGIVAAGVAVVALGTISLVVAISSDGDGTPNTAQTQTAADSGPETSNRKADPTPPATPKDRMAQIDELIKSKQSGRALKRLRELKKLTPNDARVHYLLGRLHFAVPWWSEALKNYRTAISLDASYKSDETIIKQMIHLFRSPKYASKASYFLRKHVGVAAIPELKKTATTHKAKKIRQQASYTLRRISGS